MKLLISLFLLMFIQAPLLAQAAGNTAPAPVLEVVSPHSAQDTLRKLREAITCMSPVPLALGLMFEEEG